MSVSRLTISLALLLAIAPTAIAQATNELPALKPPYAALPPGFWEQYGITVILGCVALLAVISLTAWLALRPRPQPIIPPEVLARRELEALKAQPEDGRVLSQASQIVRRYVLSAFELSSGELTTREFISAMESQPRLSAEVREAIADFLRRCDERKFAANTAPPGANGVGQALELVNRSEAFRISQAAAPPKANA